MIDDKLDRFRTMVELAPVAIALFIGPQFVITQTNERVLKYWGRTREQVMNKPLFDALPEASGQGFEELLQGVYTTGERFVAKELTVNLERNGRLERTYIDFVYEPYREADDTISGVTVVCVEITDQVISRQKIEESEKRFRSLIEEAPVATCLFVGRELRIEIVNEAMIAIWGKGPLVVGQPLAMVLPELEGQHFLATLDDLFTTGNTYEAKGDRAYLLVDGQLNTYYFDYSFIPLRDAEGEIYAIMEMAIDVTQQVLSRQHLEESEERYRLLSTELDGQVQQRTLELKARNNELAVLNDKLTESNNLLIRSNENLQKFAYVASHDLQEPLRKIQQFGDILKSQYQEGLGNGVDYLERMQLAANRMSLLIRDLLNYARISTHRDRSVFLSLHEVVNRALTDLELVIAETEAQVKVEPLPTVSGDPSQLSQLFLNLLSNALKFRQPDKTPQIAIRSVLVAADDLPPSVKPTRLASAYHRIEIADNGIGFDDNQVDRIFEVFHRLHGRNKFAGTGIGLAICEGVVANHGGGITASSQPGQGATFKVYLPI